jgi:hypothetical protein
MYSYFNLVFLTTMSFCYQREPEANIIERYKKEPGSKYIEEYKKEEREHEIEYTKIDVLVPNPGAYLRTSNELQGRLLDNAYHGLFSLFAIRPERDAPTCEEMEKLELNQFIFDKYRVLHVVAATIGKYEISYECQLCWNAYTKSTSLKGCRPKKNSKRKIHYHGTGGETPAWKVGNYGHRLHHWDNHPYYRVLDDKTNGVNLWVTSKTKNV